MIAYGRQDITAEDIAAVEDVLRSDFLTQGPAVPRFEAALCAYTGAAEAVAVNSATSALHIACLALGLGPGDVLWTSPVTFVASANAALYCGAEVDFVDIDPVTYNMSVDALAKKLATAKKLPKIVVPVHLCGRSCDMATIRALGDRYGFKIIEDAAHAIGGKYHERPVGSCAHSDITVFSFHPVKIVTTAEGGAAMTNDRALADQMRLFRSHGITRDPAMMQNAPEGAWYYEQITLGYNYRMTDMQAALGVSQMQRIDAYVQKRHAIADVYDAKLADAGAVLPRRDADVYSALHLYPVLVDNRRAVFDRMRDAGILVNVHYIPVHLQPYYRARGFRPGNFPVAEDYYARSLSLPMFPTLSDLQQATVIATLKNAIHESEQEHETGRHTRARR